MEKYPGMTTRISQSFMKTMREYLAKEECGNIVAHQYLEGKLLDRKSKEMAKGSYFEFLLSGALPKNGEMPKPEYMATPLKNKKPQDLKVSDMTSDYRVVTVNADRVKKMLTVDLGLKIIHAGKKLTKGRFEGTLDLICECTKEIDFGNGIIWKIGDRIVIDVKYSGLLFDRWNKLGWEWSNIQKEYHGTQAKQYHYISGLPFYFLVVSSTNKEEDSEDGSGKVVGPTQAKFFHVPVDSHMIDMHLAEGNDMLARLQLESEVGLVPRPEYVRCQKCPLNEGCLDKHTFPQVEVVDLTLFL
jgi:hypothetical protein